MGQAANHSSINASERTLMLPIQPDTNIKRLLNVSQMEKLNLRHIPTTNELAILHSLRNSNLNRTKNMTNPNMNRTMDFTRLHIAPLQNQVQNAFPGNDSLATNFNGIVGIAGYYDSAANDQNQHVIFGTTKEI